MRVLVIFGFLTAFLGVSHATGLLGASDGEKIEVGEDADGRRSIGADASFGGGSVGSSSTEIGGSIGGSGLVEVGHSTRGSGSVKGGGSTSSSSSFGESGVGTRSFPISGGESGSSSGGISGGSTSSKKFLLCSQVRGIRIPCIPDGDSVGSGGWIDGAKGAGKKRRCGKAGRRVSAKGKAKGAAKKGDRSGGSTSHKRLLPCSQVRGIRIPCFPDSGFVGGGSVGGIGNAGDSVGSVGSEGASYNAGSEFEANGSVSGDDQIGGGTRSIPIKSGGSDSIGHSSEVDGSGPVGSSGSASPKRALLCTDERGIRIRCVPDLIKTVNDTSHFKNGSDDVFYVRDEADGIQKTATHWPRHDSAGAGFILGGGAPEGQSKID